MPPYRKREVEYRDVLFDADAIFRHVREEITPATVQALRDIGRPFAFGIDRQSKGKEALGDPDNTGHKGRVRTVQQTAERFGLYIPAPVVRPTQQKGETPFLFDERFWYIDGEEDKATGFSFSPEIRPRLWYAYATIRRINEIDESARPAALVMAEYDRFLRADEWIKVWVNAIWKEGVDIIFPETGPVQNMHLDMICITVRARSEHLKHYRERFLDVARREHRIPYGKEPFGLQFSEDRRSVYTHPQQWEVIYQTLHRLADGRLKNASEAARWTRATYGEELAASQALIRKWFREHLHMLHSRYVTNKYRQKPCVVKQSNGMLYDYSYTKRRNKRYVAKPTPESEWLVFDVDHSRHGTKPIPPNIIQAARLRVIQVGRPPAPTTPPRTAACIAPARLVRCACCGGRVREIFVNSQSGAKLTKWDGWLLSCYGHKVRAAGQSITTREARAMEPDHRRTVHASLTIPLRERLKHWLTEEVNPLVYVDDASTDTATERLAIERRRIALQEKLTLLLTNMLTLDLKKAPAAADVLNAQINALQEEIDNCDRERQLLDARSLNAAAASSATWEMRDRFRKGFERAKDHPEFWRAVVEQMVERIVVDLDAMTWRADMHLKADSLAHLQGELLPMEKISTAQGETNSTTRAYRFAARLRRFPGSLVTGS